MSCGYSAANINKTSCLAMIVLDEFLATVSIPKAEYSHQSWALQPQGTGLDTIQMMAANSEKWIYTS